MKTTFTLSALVLGLSASAMAADPQVQAELDALKAQVQQQSQEIQQLRAQNGDTWLNQRRAEEIKGLINEVLSDAETRSSLAEGGLTAGWRDNFFLASEDGNFLLRVRGQEQIRYVFNNSQHGGITDETVAIDPDTGEVIRTRTGPNSNREHFEGFENRRTMISFDGHLFDPKFTYQVSLLLSDADTLTSRGTAVLQNAWAAYEFADGWQVKLGQFKAPFLRDELVHSSKQLAVERSLITDLLTVDYTQGLQLGYNGELVGAPIRAAVMVHDGSFGANTPALVPDVDIAVAGRAEVLLAGSWEQFDDYATWSDDSFGLLVGAAIDWENSEGETFPTAADVLKWTADASVELPQVMGLNATAAITGRHLNGRERGLDGVSSSNQIAVLAQAGIFIIPDKADVFARAEWIDLDHQSFAGAEAVGPDEITLYTIGGNYYFQRHAAKLTLDVIWAPDSTIALRDANWSGNGFFASAADDQVVIRGQFQFLF